MVNKSTLILGVSINKIRYSNKAVNKLFNSGIPIIAIGKNIGEICGIKIQNYFPQNIKINTVSIYINVSHQDQYINSIIKLSPNRVIFNPGTENPKLFKLLSSNGIQCENSCTLALLSTKQY